VETGIVTLATFGIVIFPLFAAAMVYAAMSDLLTMTIPNRLSLALVAGFVVLFPFTGQPIAEAGMHLAAGAVVLGVCFGCFAFGWMGGGDAKFASAVALWLGWSYLVEFLVTAAVYGGVLTLAILVFRRQMLPAFALRQPWIERLHDSQTGVPYGIALAAAALSIYPHTPWLRLAGV
jgi:prepilin peptidase CpaA